MVVSRRFECTPDTIRTLDYMCIVFTCEIFSVKANRVFTRSSKRPALHLLEVCWTFAGSCKHSINNADFGSLYFDPLGSRRPAQAGVKEGYPLKVVILPLLARLA